MSYYRAHSALGVTRAQQKTLIDIPDEDLRAMEPEQRLNLVLRRQEVKAAESAAFWDAVASAVTVGVPLLAFFGISSLASKKGAKK